MAFELLDKVIVGSGGQSTIDFNNIAAVDGADLKLVISGRTDASGIATEWMIRVNGSSGAAYSTRSLSGDGSSLPSARNAGNTTFWENLSLAKAGSTTSTFSNAELYIPNFSQPSSGSFQGAAAAIMSVSENNAGEAYQGFAGFYRDVDEAVTSISVFGQAGSLVEHSTAYLYQIS
tara:strand:+ start:460 stop:987 length:528 start_codon:yes stop_codon:yes gene_type:complete